MNTLNATMKKSQELSKTEKVVRAVCFTIFAVVAVILIIEAFKQGDVNFQL